MDTIKVQYCEANSHVMSNSVASVEYMINPNPQPLLPGQMSFSKIQSVIKNNWAWTSTPRRGYPLLGRGYIIHTRECTFTARGWISTSGVDIHTQEFFITDCNCLSRDNFAAPPFSVLI